MYTRSHIQFEFKVLNSNYDWNFFNIEILNFWFFERKYWIIKNYVSKFKKFKINKLFEKHVSKLPKGTLYELNYKKIWIWMCQMKKTQ
jgi:hypothetical protein